MTEDQEFIEFDDEQIELFKKLYDEIDWNFDFSTVEKGSTYANRLQVGAEAELEGNMKYEAIGLLRRNYLDTMRKLNKEKKMLERATFVGQKDGDVITLGWVAKAIDM